MARRGVALPLLLLSLVLAGLGGLPGTPAVQAEAEVGVDVSNFQFSPDAVTIDPGDSVRWSWVSGTHNVETSDGSAQWCSTRSSGDCVRTFPDVGTFNYRCGIHPGSMEATVTVRGTDPVVTIDTPADGQSVDGTFTASGTATHPMGIDTVHVTFGGTTEAATLTADEVETATTVAWTVDFDTTAVPNGAERLRATAVSTDGGEASAEVDLVIDNPPWVDLVAVSMQSETDLLSSHLIAHVTNDGNIGAAGTVFVFEYSYKGAWRPIGTVQQDLAAFEAATVLFEWPSDGKIGAFEVRLRIDPEGQHDETDTTNNEATTEAAFVSPLVPGTDPFEP